MERTKPPFPDNDVRELFERDYVDSRHDVDEFTGKQLYDMRVAALADDPARFIRIGREVAEEHAVVWVRDEVNRRLEADRAARRASSPFRRFLGWLGVQRS